MFIRSALLWSPNIAASYKNVRRGDASVTAADFQAMDTNNNGVLEINDNPYEPYYPGMIIHYYRVSKESFY